MFHNMDAHNPVDLLKHFPILVFVESYIYQIDDQMEDQLLPSSNATLQKVEVKVIMGASTVEDCIKPLQQVLAEKKLLTKRIDEELQRGIEYWILEKSLCQCLFMKTKILMSDVMRAVRLKSFDYRVLNLLLYELSNQPVNERHMEFLSVSEFLVEISDDLFDYEEDVLNNTFNILRMFVRVYGSAKAPRMLAQLIAETEIKYDMLLDKLEPRLASQYRKRCEEAVIEGGSYSQHTMGSWTVPPLIIDEDMYRERYKAEVMHGRVYNVKSTYSNLLSR